MSRQPTRLPVEVGFADVSIVKETAKMRMAPPRTVRPAHRLAPRVRIAGAILSAATLSALFTGCWPFHRGPTPQQQYFEALGRGDAAQANQTWLNMSDEDREKLLRGEGIAPRPSPEQIQAAILRHKPGDTTPIVIAPESGSATGGWQNLPHVLSATPVPQATR